MQFTMGTVAGFVKSMELKFKWGEVKKDPKKAGSWDAVTAMQPKKKANTLLDDMAKSEIDRKLKSGKKLSPAEMDYLRENDPVTYEKARRINKEREEFERDLRRCKTKEDVFKCKISKTAALSADKNGGEELLMRVAAMSDAHGEFVASKEFSALPKDNAELAEARRDKREKTRPEPEPGNNRLYNRDARHRGGRACGPKSRSRPQYRCAEAGGGGAQNAGYAKTWGGACVRVRATQAGKAEVYGTRLILISSQRVGIDCEDFFASQDGQRGDAEKDRKDIDDLAGD